MNDCVIDASVVGAALFPEAYSKEAKRLLRSNTQLFAPDMIRAEVANLLWKRQRRGEIDGGSARQLLQDFFDFPIEIGSSESVLASALDLAIRTGRSAYDSLYLATAIKRGCRLATADERFANALKAGPFAQFVWWLGAGDANVT